MIWAAAASQDAAQCTPTPLCGDHRAGEGQANAYEMPVLLIWPYGGQTRPSHDSSWGHSAGPTAE